MLPPAVLGMFPEMGLPPLGLATARHAEELPHLLPDSSRGSVVHHQNVNARRRATRLPPLILTDHVHADIAAMASTRAMSFVEKVVQKSLQPHLRQGVYPHRRRHINAPEAIPGPRVPVAVVMVQAVAAVIRVIRIRMTSSARITTTILSPRL